MVQVMVLINPTLLNSFFFHNYFSYLILYFRLPESPKIVSWVIVDEDGEEVRI